VCRITGLYRQLKANNKLGKLVIMSDVEEYYWVKDGHAFSAARICSENDDDTVTFEEFESNRRIVGTMESIVGSVAMPYEESLLAIKNDLVTSDDISEASILWSLGRKFAADLIYSSIGTILVSINPYKNIDALFGEAVLQEYLEEGKHRAAGAMPSAKASAPHIYSIAMNTYTHMCQSRKTHTRQAVVISGESGSGKTEATKRLMRYLSSISAAGLGSGASSSAAGEAVMAPIVPIEDKVLGINPLLESFGNAKTLRNDNSSRFGRWLQIHFKRASGGFQPKLMGADITEYLLEKSRVVGQSQGERNYHIFYQLLSDQSNKMGKASEYAYLNQSGCIAIDGVDDAAEYRLVREALSNLGISKSVQGMINSTVKGILFLGNTLFEDFSSDLGDGSRVTAYSKTYLAKAADCFGLDAVELQKALTVRSILVHGEKIDVLLTPKQAVDARNALAKEVYELLFKFLVAWSNVSLMPVEGVPAPGSANEGEAVIGLLDIFGFEIFELNSLEQLSINFANEKLQQYFLDFVLKREQQTYEDEGVFVEKIEPLDNAEVLHLIEAPRVGIFHRLNDELKIPKPSDLNFLRMIVADYKIQHGAAAAEGKVPLLHTAVKMPATCFEILHFAGTVRYDCTNFVEKNKDKLYEHLADLLSTTTSEAFKKILQPLSEPKGKNTTLLTNFQEQLGNLMHTLQISEPHFVRCVKSNNTKSPGVLDAAMTLEQLRYSGVLEAIQIRKLGFPIRRTLQQFYNAYWVLSEHTPKSDFFNKNGPLTDSDKCSLIVQDVLSGESAQRRGLEPHMLLGHSMVMLRQVALTHLDALKMVWYVRMAIKLQCHIRRKSSGRKYALLSEVRLQLAELIRQSKFRNNTNFTVSDALKEMIRYSEEDLHMQCSILIEAKQVSERISSMKELATRAQMQSTARFSKEIGDVAKEHTIILATIAEANVLKMNDDHGSAEVESLIAREVEIRQQADALKDLRTAVDMCNSDGIEAALVAVEAISELTNNGVCFCMADEQSARKLLKQLGQIEVTINSCVQVLLEFQHAYEQQRDKPATVNWLIANAGKYGADADRLLQPARAKAPPSITIRNITGILHEVASSLQHWMDNKWGILADVISGITDECNALKNIPLLGDPALSPSGEVTHVSVKEYGWIHTFIAPIVDAHVTYLVSDLEAKLINPTLKAAYEQGRLEIGLDVGLSTLVAGLTRVHQFAELKIDYVNFHVLAPYQSEEPSVLSEVVEAVRKYNWLSKDSLIVLQQMEIIANVRKFSQMKHFDMVLRQTETAEATVAHKSKFDQLLAKIKRFDVTPEVEAGMSKMLGPDEPDELLHLYAEFDSRSVRENELSLINFNLELNQARDASVVQKCFHLVSQLLARGKVSGECVGKLEVHNVSTEALEEIAWEIADLVQNSLPATNVVTGAVHMLSQLMRVRKLFISGSKSMPNGWQDVLDLTASPEFVALSTTALKKEVRRCTASKVDVSWDNVWASVISFNTEIELIVAQCKNNLALMKLTGVFTVGQYAGVSEGVSATELEAVLDEAKTCSTGPLKWQGVSETLQIMLGLAELLVDARKAFADKNATSEQKETLTAITDFFADIPKSEEADIDESDFQYWTYKLNIPGTCDELMCMQLGVDFAASLDSIRAGLQQAPVKYLISQEQQGSLAPGVDVNPDANLLAVAKSEVVESISEGGGEEEDNEEEEKDIAQKSPFQDTNIKQGKKAVKITHAEFIAALEPRIQATAREAARLMGEENLCYNMFALDTALLTAGLAEAKRLACDLTDTSAEQTDLIRAAELIRLMRIHVLSGLWRDANDVLTTLKEEGIIARVALIHEEVLEAADTIQSYIVISQCRNALKSGMNRGPTGLVNPAKISVVELEDIMAECGRHSSGVSSVRAQKLIAACWLIIDLRKSFINGDMSQTKDVLAKCDAEGIAQPGSATAICFEEITRAKVEEQNWEVLTAIRSAIIAEKVPITIESLIDVPKVSIVELSDAYNLGMSLKTSHRGAVVLEMLNLADIIIKARKAIQQNNWFALTSVITLWRQEVEEFQMAIKNLEVDITNAAANTIIERRGSVIRRSSVLSNNGKKRNASKGSGIMSDSDSEQSKTSVPPPVKIYDLWPSFEELAGSITAELLSVDQHFATLELETGIYTALRENGMTKAMVGNIDKFQISLSGIEKCQAEMKLHVGKGMKLSSVLANVFVAAELIHKVRKCVIEDQWDVLPALLEDSVTGGARHQKQSMMPDMCRKEIEAVRHEIENRWIISNITSSMEYGALTGELEQVDPSQVSYEHLVACISSCKDLTPRTEVARNLVYTAEIVVPMRRLLTAKNIDLFNVRERATDALTPAVVSLLHPIVLPEIRLMQAYADDRILCAAFKNALQKHGPTGTPGRLDTTGVGTAELDRVLMTAGSTTIKTEMAASLLNACRTAKSLRAAILRTRSKDSNISAESWGTIRQIVMKLHEAHRISIEQHQEKLKAENLASGNTADVFKSVDKKLKEEEDTSDVGWEMYKEEVTLITRDAHIAEVKVNIEESIQDAVVSYQNRAKIHVDPTQDYQELPTKSNRKQKLTAASMNMPAKYDLNVSGLTKLMHYAENLDFKSEILNHYIEVCKFLKLVRLQIINGRVSELDDVLYNLDPKLVNAMKWVPESLTELKFAKAEYISSLATNLLVEALIARVDVKKVTTGATSKVQSLVKVNSSLKDAFNILTRATARINGIAINDTPGESSKVTIGESELLEEAEKDTQMNLNPDDPSAHHQGLLDAVRAAKKLPLTSIMSNQMLQCAAYSFQLRVGLSGQITREVSESLKWMRLNSDVLPLFIQQEAKDAYIAHQNYLLELGLNRALLTGRAIGRNGQTDYTTIRTLELTKLVAQSKELKVSSVGNASLMKLLDAAEDVLLVRTALSNYNFLGLHDALESIHDRRAIIHPLIIDEIFSCRTELNNEISIISLRCALCSFIMDSNIDNDEMSVVRSTGNIPVTDTFLRVCKNTKYMQYKNELKGRREKDRGRTLSYYFHDNNRAYCPANIRHADVDPGTIHVAIFDEALKIANKCGIYCVTAQNLFKTVMILRDLRLAMKKANWSSVESILINAQLERTAESARHMDLFTSKGYAVKMSKSVDFLAIPEVLVIQNQLEIRAAIAEVLKRLKTGWARCDNGVVSTDNLEIENLREAVQRCNTSVMTKNDNVLESSEEEKGGNYRHNPTGNAAQEQLALLMKSADYVIRVRKLFMSKKTLSDAGNLATEALLTKLHASVVTELTLYSKEVHRALKINSLETDLKLGMVRGDMETLEALILRAREVIRDKLQLNDLGLVRILQQAQAVYKAFRATRKALRKSINSYDQSFIENSLECAKTLQYSAPLVFQTEHRLSQICRFELFVNKYRWEHNGALTEDSAFQDVLSKAAELGMSHHPWSCEAEVCLRLNTHSMRTLLIASSISVGIGNDKGTKYVERSQSAGQPYVAATETMRIKRRFLMNPKVRAVYALEKFPFLRTPEDFALRMSLANKNTMITMLLHIDQTLGTSLTNLSPDLSALSVWMFSHCIRGIEHSIYTKIEVHLKKIIGLGRICVRMRDEILLQIVKQLRSNTTKSAKVTDVYDTSTSDRLWRTLCACLAHFPPSACFETYFELFLLMDAEKSTAEIVSLGAAIRERELLVASGKNTSGVYAPARSQGGTRVHHGHVQKKEDELQVTLECVKARRQYARHCLRLMHEAIYIYGYDRKITAPYESSLTQMNIWLLKDDIRQMRCIDVQSIAAKKNSMSALFKAAMKDKMANENVDCEDPGWQEPSYKDLKTVSSIKHLLANTAEEDDVFGEAEEVDPQRSGSVRSKKVGAALFATAMASKLNRVMKAKRQSMILDHGINEIVTSAPGLSESKATKKQALANKVGMLSSKMNKKDKDVPLSERKDVDNMSVTLQNKHGGMDVMHVGNVADYMPNKVAVLLRDRNNQFSDESFWSSRLARYAHDETESAGKVINLPLLCLKVTGKPIGSFKIETAASKLFSFILDDIKETKKEEVKHVPLLYDFDSQIIRYMVTGKSVTRVVEAARMHRHLVRPSFGKHELRDLHATEKQLDIHAQEKELPHAITGDYFFTDKQNTLSDQRTTWLRRIVSLHRETTTDKSGDDAISSDVVQKFWTNVILFSAEVFPASKAEGEDMAVDALLYRDLICVGLDLLMAEIHPDTRRLKDSLNHTGKSSRESLYEKKVKQRINMMTNSRSRLPTPQRTDANGYHVYTNNGLDDGN